MSNRKWYLTIYFGHTNKVYRICEGSHDELVERMRSMAKDYVTLGMQLTQDHSTAVAGYPMMELRGSNQLDDDRFLQLMVSDNGEEYA